VVGQGGCGSRKLVDTTGAFELVGSVGVEE